MKIVVAGKGGVGKTVVSGTLARALARAGHSVVALDCDINPMLGISLGLGPDRTEDVAAVRQALEEGRVAHEPTTAGFVDRFGADAPDGVRLVVASRIESFDPGCTCCGVSPERLLGELEGDGQVVIGDAEAGTGTVLRLAEGQADVVLVVAQPTAKAIDIAARAVRTATHRGIRVIVLANRIRGEDDLAAVRAELGEHEIVVIDDDAGVSRADREGRAPIDVAPHGPAVQAITALAERLAGGRGSTA